MLKIKDNIDIEEVAQVFGFKPKYDEDTGEAIAYEKIHPLKDRGVIIKKEQEKKRIKISRRRDTDEKVWRINPYYSYFDIDTLFDLIQDGLVEKE